MFLLKKILSSLILPPGGPVTLALFGLWLARRHPRSGHALIGVALTTLLLLSMPWVANDLSARLADTAPISPEQLARAQAIVVLGGGNTHGALEYGGGDTVSELELVRLRYAARLAKGSGLPVAIAGGAPRGGEPESEVMRAALATDFGVPTRWIETSSRDTAENAANLAPQLHAAGIERIALVTHVWHMPRARTLFERHGFEVLAAPTGFTAASSGHWIYRWLPEADALRQSSYALHEWLGRSYYLLTSAR
jgi:uncharacterized SAM-binding protein YcdF (DUF218 family)